MPIRHRATTVLGIGLVFAWGTTYYLLSILAKPIAADTGWPFSWIIGGLTLASLVAALVSVAVGRAIERHGGRPIFAYGTILHALGLGLLALAPNLALYFAAWAVLGIAMAATLYDAAFSTLGRLLGDTARPAIATVTLWGGFASTICWPVSAALVETVGWRGTCAAYAAFLIVVVLPLHVFGLPKEAQRTIDAAKRSAEVGPAPRRPLAILLLAGIVTAGSAISAAWAVHIIAILEAGGIGLAAAVALGALIGPAQVAGRIVEMAIGARLHPIWTLAASVALVGAGQVLLWSDMPMPAVALIAFGAGNGIFFIARGTVPLALFGPEGYAVLMGRLAAPAMVAQALAPPAAAVLFEATGAKGTMTALAALALVSLAAVAMLVLVSRRRATGR